MSSPGRALGGILAGAAVFLTLLLLPPPSGMELAAFRAAAVAALMAIWWITEAIPIAATALLPVALFPLLGVSPIREAAAPYANPLIFLFMGGFLLALGVERWGLHRRMALAILSRAGQRPAALVGGFMVATAFLSMWLSNTATAVLMLPIALSLIHLVEADGAAAGPAAGSGPLSDPFAVSLLLGIAYGATLGGMGTLIGTPPNALLAGFMLEQYGVTIGFAQWMVVGLPLVAILLTAAWVLLTRLLFPVREWKVGGAREVIRQEIAGLGPWNGGEKRVAVVFCLTAAAWIFRPWIDRFVPGLSDPGIAMLGALSLFVLPVDGRRGVFVLDWAWARRLPWGVLLLFGGGLSLADALSATGLAAWIGEALGVFRSWPTLALLLLVVTVIVFLTELTSNTASAATFLPVMATLALVVGENPLLLAVPVTLGASCAFMMPVATPPNAIVFGSGKVTIPQMARAGFWLNLVGIAVVTALAYSLLLLAFGVEVGVVPEWARGR